MKCFDVKKAERQAKIEMTHWLSKEKPKKYRFASRTITQRKKYN